MRTERGLLIRTHTIATLDSYLRSVARNPGPLGVFATHTLPVHEGARLCAWLQTHR